MTTQSQAISIGALLALGLPVLTTEAEAQQLYFPWAPATTTQTSGTITTANTFQTALAANPSRHGCEIQNQSTDSVFVFMGTLASATAAKSYELTPLGGGNDTFRCNKGPFVLTDNVNITAGTTGDAFVVLSW